MKDITERVFFKKHTVEFQSGGYGVQIKFQPGQKVKTSMRDEDILVDCNGIWIKMPEEVFWKI